MSLHVHFYVGRGLLNAVHTCGICFQKYGLFERIMLPLHSAFALEDIDEREHGIEGTAVSNPHIDIARVKPIDLTAPAFRLGEGQVDLTRASDLSGPIGIGGAWQTPPYVALSDDPFDERYGAWGTPAPTR